MPYKEHKKTKNAPQKWRGCVVENGHRNTALFLTKKEAIEWEAQKRKELKGEATKKKSGLDLLTLCAKYLDFAERYTKKTRQEKEALCKRILKAWGPDRLIEAITPADVLKFLTTQARKRSNHSSNRDRKNLMAMISFGIKYLGVLANPVAITSNLPHEKAIQYTPPQDDILKLLMVATREERVFLNCYLQTGARRSEIFRLTWANDINFEKRNIRLGTRKTRDGSMEHELLPMSDDLFDDLKWWWDNHPIKQSPFVFYNTNKACRHYGKPFTTRRKFMHGICKRAGIKEFGFHALRRYVASVLADTHKVSAKTIQRILRHKNVTTTERYIQNINNDLEVTMNMLSVGVVKIHEGDTRSGSVGQK